MKSTRITSVYIYVNTFPRSIAIPHFQLLSSPIDIQVLSSSSRRWISLSAILFILRLSLILLAKILYHLQSDLLCFTDLFQFQKIIWIFVFILRLIDLGFCSNFTYSRLELNGFLMNFLLTVLQIFGIY